jgi:hypothetical protein
MASIQVRGIFSEATLTLPDDDGDYGWQCNCGQQSETVQPIEDAIAHAEIHVDMACPSRRPLKSERY